MPSCTQEIQWHHLALIIWETLHLEWAGHWEQPACLLLLLLPSYGWLGLLQFQCAGLWWRYSGLIKDDLWKKQKEQNVLHRELCCYPMLVVKNWTSGNSSGTFRPKHRTNIKLWDACLHISSSSPSILLICLAHKSGWQRTDKRWGRGITCCWLMIVQDRLRFCPHTMILPWRSKLRAHFEHSLKHFRLKEWETSFFTLAEAQGMSRPELQP